MASSILPVIPTSTSFFRCPVKNKVDLLFSVVSARFFSGENLLDSK